MSDFEKQLTEEKNPLESVWKMIKRKGRKQIYYETFCNPITWSKKEFLHIISP